MAEQEKEKLISDGDDVSAVLGAVGDTFLLETTDQSCQNATGVESVVANPVGETAEIEKVRNDYEGMHEYGSSVDVSLPATENDTHKDDLYDITMGDTEAEVSAGVEEQGDVDSVCETDDGLVLVANEVKVADKDDDDNEDDDDEIDEDALLRGDEDEADAWGLGGANAEGSADDGGEGDDESSDTDDESALEMNSSVERDKDGSANEVFDITGTIPDSDDEAREEPKHPTWSDFDSPGEDESDTDEDLIPLFDSDELEDDTSSEEDNAQPHANPLFSILPDEYRKLPVRKFFPEFRKGKVLRFSRLFGKLKQADNSLWRGAKSYRGRKKVQPKPVETEQIDLSGQSAPGDHLETESKPEGLCLDFAPTPPAEECATDDEMLQLRPEDPASVKKRINARTRASEQDPVDSVAPWRHGPAAYWYDLMGVSESGQDFNYGFKLKDKSEEAKKIEEEETFVKPVKLPEQAFYLVNQVRWEDNIIWDVDALREQLRKTLGSGKQPICGWIPTHHTRTYEQFMAVLKSGGFNQMLSSPTGSLTPRTGSGVNALGGGANPAFPFPPTGVPGSDAAGSGTGGTSGTGTKEPGPSFHVFPPDNMEFINRRWEDDIIWDVEAMDKIPEPKILTLDLTDEHTILTLPEDKPSDSAGASFSDSPSKDGSRKDHQFTKRSQMIAGRVANRQNDDDEDDLAQTSGQMMAKDPFNLSNDEYYMPKNSASLASIRGGFLQHSIPSQNLHPSFFPTYFSPFSLRHFHRPVLRLPKTGPLSSGAKAHPLVPLTKNIEKKQKQRDQERKVFGGGELFFMRAPDDLSNKDGELVWFEYSEEHPPLISQPGMASKIRNYYKRTSGKEGGSEPKFAYGDTAYTHTSPFLGSLAPGEALQSLENNLFRAPVYQHQTPSSDFLVVRTKEGFSIRAVPTIFCVGQLCPVYEVPSPNSKRASNFVRDFLLVYIYRAFWASSDEPRRIRMEDIKRAFPHYAESSIRKRIRQCADFKRIGSGAESNFWVLKEHIRLPSLEELRAIVTPEICCAYYSMVAAEQRLKDAGYGEKYFFTPEDDDDDQPVKMDDEVKCAPWNTTRAFISSVKGKCLLDLSGVSDPTGCGEGFSYIRESAKPPKNQQEPSEKMKQQQAKRTVTGTDADLRKLSLKDAKALLKKFGITDEEIKTLSRWEIIDVIRTLSTQHARMGGTGITKFARGSMRFSLAEIQQRFKSECQRIFDLQNKVLSCTEPVSSDDESSAEDSDLDEMGKNIESMLSNKKQQPSASASFDAEEEERRELQKLIHGDGKSSKKGGPMGEKSVDDEDGEDADDEKDGGTLRDPSGKPIPPASKWRKLRITRTIRGAHGKEHVVEETIVRQEVIDAYCRVRADKDESFIRHFVQSSVEYKEEKRKEKRRIQDRLRRIKKNEQKAKDGKPVGRTPRKSTVPKKPKPIKAPLKMNCSACGGRGHMRTNKDCPMYSQTQQPQQNIAKTDEQVEAELAKSLPTDKKIVSMDGMKMKVSKDAMEQYQKVQRDSLILKIPKTAVSSTSPSPQPPTPPASISVVSENNIPVPAQPSIQRSLAPTPSPIQTMPPVVTSAVPPVISTSANIRPSFLSDILGNPSIAPGIFGEQAAALLNQSLPFPLFPQPSTGFSFDVQQQIQQQQQLHHLIQQQLAAAAVSKPKPPTPRAPRAPKIYRPRAPKQPGQMRMPRNQRLLNQMQQQQQSSVHPRFPGAITGPRMKTPSVSIPKLPKMTKKQLIGKYAASAAVAPGISAAKAALAAPPGGALAAAAAVWAARPPLKSKTHPPFSIHNHPSLKMKLKRGSQGNFSRPGTSGMPASGTAAGSLKRRISVPAKQTTASLDYLRRPSAGGLHERRRADPKVSISSVFEGIIADLKEHLGPHVEPFLAPVNRKDAPSYHDVVKMPMNLLTLRINVQKHLYATREDFLKDLKLIVENSALFNGPNHRITESARVLFQYAAEKVEEKENQLMKLEKAINPLLDDDEKAFAHIFTNIVEKLKSIPKSFVFHMPVDRKKFPLYYERVHDPMDLGTMESKVKKTPYDSVDSFLKDVELVYRNCELFNGPKHAYTPKAKEIYDTAVRLIKENEDQLVSLESNIKECKRRAMEDLDSMTPSEAGSVGSFDSHHSQQRSGSAGPFKRRRSSTPGPISRGPSVAEIEGSLLNDDLLMSDEEGETATANKDLPKTENPVSSGKKSRKSKPKKYVKTVSSEGFNSSDSPPKTAGSRPGSSVELPREDKSEDSNSRPMSAAQFGDRDSDPPSPHAKNFQKSIAGTSNQMEIDGQLYAELAMSDSDEEGGAGGERVKVVTADDDDVYDFSMM